jgi:hypothetical protein
MSDFRWLLEGRCRVCEVVHHIDEMAQATTEPIESPDWMEQSRVSDQQIDDEHDQQNTADSDAAAISPPGISEPASEKEEQHENNQD